MKKILTLLAIALALPAVAQTSASFMLTEHAFNAGGHPSAGVMLTSANYQITLDALGDTMARPRLSSLSFVMNCGWSSGLRSAGEVRGLRFTHRETLTWDPEQSVGDYNLYRDLMSNMSGLGYGDCEQQGIPGTTTSETEEPASGDGFFYLVTAVNRLDEEGTKGWGTAGGERQGTVCP